MSTPFADDSLVMDGARPRLGVPHGGDVMPDRVLIRQPVAKLGVPAAVGQHGKTEETKTKQNKLEEATDQIPTNREEDSTTSVLVWGG